MNKKNWETLLPRTWFAVVTASSCEMMDEGVAQRDADRLAGVGLKHNVISVRPLVGTLGRSRSNSSAASRSTALYLPRRNRIVSQPCMKAGNVWLND